MPVRRRRAGCTECAKGGYSDDDRTMSTTAGALETITDEGLFEALAVAVLRRAVPAYSCLIETGTNASGRPVRSPVDGIALGFGGSANGFLTAHHTTCSAAELRRKWLGEDGDLQKAARLLKAERMRTPAATMTLVLTTNKVPNEELVRDVGFHASAAGIVIDIWDRSRISDVLDNEPYGHWLRANYLGIAQQLLSVELLHDISRRSVDALEATLLDLPAAWIDRGLDRRLKATCSRGAVSLLVMPSGAGKSTGCVKVLKSHLAAGGFGLWIPAHVLEQAQTLEQVVQIVLHAYCPSISPNAGLRALVLGEEAATPLLLVVDDVNRASDPVRTVGHLLALASSRSSDRNHTGRLRGATVLCPVWPQVVQQLPEQQRREADRLAIAEGAMTHEEAVDAVVRRAELRGETVTPLWADGLARDLAGDPLLIALAVSGSGPVGAALDVILGFVDGQCHGLEREPGAGLSADYFAALDALAWELIQRGVNEVTWGALDAWFKDRPAVLERLRELCKQRTVCQLHRSANGESNLMFRHDRVRDALLARCIQQRALQGTLPLSVIAEPYYAPLVGAALAMMQSPRAFLGTVQEANPLALFHGLRALLRSASPQADVLVETIQRTSREPQFHQRAADTLRWRMQMVLQDIDDPRVLRIAELFPGRSWALDRARFRNGEAAGAARYCYHDGPNVRSSDRDALVQHVKQAFGRKFVEDVGTLLRSPSLSGRETIGTLHLAGFIGDPSLASAIRSAWERNAIESDLLTAFVWAAGQCGGADTDALLEPMVAAWAALPEPLPSGRESTPTRAILYHAGLHWGFARGLPEEAIRFFVRVPTDDPMAWWIAQLLDHVDQPESVRFVAEQMAIVSRRVAGTRAWSPWLDSLSRRGLSSQPSVSRASAVALERLWQNVANDEHLRKRAFQLWRNYATRDDLPRLRDARGDLLGDQALRYRLELGDETAVGDLRATLQSSGNRAYWWQFLRESWLDEYLDDLDAELCRRRSGMAADQTAGDTDWVVSEIIARLAPKVASDILEKHWSHLKTSHCFVAAALFVATPACTALVAEAVHQHSNPKELFEFMSHVWRVGGREERNRLSPDRLAAVLPYLDHLSDHDLHSLWSACNVDGYQDWRRQHLDARLAESWKAVCAVNDEDLFPELDRIAASDHRRTHHFWFDRFQERGDPPDRPLRVIEKWLDSRGTLEAFEVAASCVVEGGTRKDLKLLEPHLAKLGSAAAKEIYDDAVFGVRVARL